MAAIVRRSEVSVVAVPLGTDRLSPSLFGVATQEVYPLGGYLNDVGTQRVPVPGRWLVGRAASGRWLARDSAIRDASLQIDIDRKPNTLNTWLECLAFAARRRTDRLSPEPITLEVAAHFLIHDCEARQFGGAWRRSRCDSRK